MSDETLQRYKRELERVGMSPRDMALQMLHFYRLRWATDEQEMQFLFASAEKRTDEEFQALCNSLVEEASRRAVNRSLNASPNNRRFIGWGEIVVHMAVVLEDRGFVAINPLMIAAGFDGSTIIDNERRAAQDDGTRCPDFVIEHNRGRLEASRVSRTANSGGGPITITGGTPTTGPGGALEISAAPSPGQDVELGAGPTRRPPLPAISLLTTTSAASDGQTLPQTRIHVASTEGFPPSGRLVVQTSTGPQPIAYSGVSRAGPVAFEGCVGGTGVLSTGGAVGFNDYEGATCGTCHSDLRADGWCEFCRSHVLGARMFLLRCSGCGRRVYTQETRLCEPAFCPECAAREPRSGAGFGDFGERGV